MNLHQSGKDKNQFSSPNPQRKNRWGRNFFSLIDFRLSVIVFLIVFGFLAIGIRIVYLTFIDKGRNTGDQILKRGTITDAEGVPLAFSEERYNLYFNPKAGSLNQEQIGEILTYLGEKINSAKVISGLQGKKTFLLARYVKKELTDPIIELDFPGLLVDKTMYRNYPYGSTLSQTLGFVGHEGTGLNGLEYKYNDFLNYESHPGYERNLVLNIKIDFQRKIEELIKSAVKKNNADYGSILVQEINTGRIIGLANYPVFDLNRFQKYSTSDFINTATSYLLEPGSIFKIFMIAYLIERFNPRLDEKKYFCKGYYELSNGEVIKCHGVHGAVSIQDIIKYSCNSGIIQATEDLSPEEMFDFLRRLRIGENHGIDLPGESRGLILKLSDWGIRTKATIPLGHGLALTPLHLINIFSALIGKGYLYQPQVVHYQEESQNGELISRKEAKPEIINKIVSEEVSQKATELLYYGTIKGSTGYSSRSTGFEQVFGKTGTSQLANIRRGGYYTNRYHSTFAGGYPFNNPSYSILVVVSQPKNEYYGGKVAAPIYAQVVEALNQDYHLTEERSVENLKNRVSQPSPDDEFMEEVVIDRLPDFRGLSLRKALSLLDDFKRIQKENRIEVDYRLEGKGFVTKQNPAPGAAVKKNLTIDLFFK